MKTKIKTTYQMKETFIEKLTRHSSKIDACDVRIVLISLNKELSSYNINLLKAA